MEEKLKLSLIRDIIKLTDNQVEFVLNNLKKDNNNPIEFRSGGFQNANF